MSRPITLYRVSLPSFSSLFQISWIFHAICSLVKNLNRFCMLLLWLYCAAPPLKKKGERGKGNWDIFATRAHKPVCTGRSFYANLSVWSPFINQSSGIWMGVARLLLCNVSLHPLPDLNELKGKDIDIWAFDQINLIWFHIQLPNEANWYKVYVKQVICIIRKILI